MARVRYIGAEPVTVPELGDRTVQPDELIEVPDDRFEGYVCQPQTWESVDEPKWRGDDGPEAVAFTSKEAVSPKKTTAAKSAAKEG
ncbi:hypothetical protein OG369_09800 [Streptomyces sp. NBC_01221]|uniref:hypothetical protein n=1 Tax=Streptomyces sp. NBC_01221 TaxID=2903782 RepID=UPI00224E10E7|nr:hypothetical protein [Streptomyces sp. NBC_01221]MCX4786464.1 hypothetical protein [Streptomyces sp. NBC_01221]